MAQWLREPKFCVHRDLYSTLDLNQIGQSSEPDKHSERSLDGMDTTGDALNSELTVVLG